MPDYPYVYGTGALRPVAPGGTRIRLFRRRQEETEGDKNEPPHGEQGQDQSGWAEMLREAVEELNASLLRAGAPFRCSLEEDEGGLVFQVRREGGQPGPPEVEEEILDPAELPRWLARIRSRLGVLIDEKA